MADNAKTSFSFESYQDKDSILKYLDAIKEGFINEKIVLRANSKEIVLFPPDLIKLEINMQKVKNTKSLNISFSWKEKDNK